MAYLPKQQCCVVMMSDKKDCRANALIDSKKLLRFY